MGKSRKSAVQIRFEILEYLFFNSKNQLRMTVWRKSTNLSYDDFLKHLTFLEEKQLVKDPANAHRNTPLTLLFSLQRKRKIREKTLQNNLTLSITFFEIILSVLSAMYTFFSALKFKD
jgi:predicted transcriptional regulator